MRHYACLPIEPVARGEYALSTVQDGHVELIRQWRNAQMDVLRQDAPIGLDQQQSYFASMIWPTLAEHQPSNILLTFYRHGRPIGYGGLVHVAWRHYRAEVSFLLEPELASDSASYAECFAAYLGLIKQVGFEVLGFQRLFTETYAMRTDHIAILESNGFTHEGRLRRHVIVDGEFVDSLIHGCLKDND